MQFCQKRCWIASEATLNRNDLSPRVRSNLTTMPTPGATADELLVKRETTEIIEKSWCFEPANDCIDFMHPNSEYMGHCGTLVETLWSSVYRAKTLLHTIYNRARCTCVYFRFKCESYCFSRLLLAVANAINKLFALSSIFAWRAVAHPDSCYAPIAPVKILIGHQPGP